MAGAYYNEIDDYAAEWLRNLIRDGHIAPGEVDTRSIEDVHPDDLRGFTQCHFFAGLGLWSYALRRAGWDDERPIWTGSCPCQPFSSAGKGAGFGDERHLWPAFFHLIAQCRPQAVCGEQVASKDGYAWLDLVQTDMEGLAYAFWPVVLPVAGVGGPHERHRLWWVGLADADGGAVGQQPRILFGDESQHGRRPALGSHVAAPSGDDLRRLADAARGHTAVDAGHGPRPGDAPSAGTAGGVAGRSAVDGVGDAQDGHGWSEQQPGGTGSGRAGPAGTSAVGGVADAAGERFGETGQPLAHAGGAVVPADGGARAGLVGDAERARLERHAGDGDGATGREAPERPIAAAGVPVGLADAGGGFVPQPVGGPQGRNGDAAIGTGDGMAGFSAGGDADADTLGGVGHNQWTGPLNGFWRDADWLFCTDGKWRPVEPGTRPLAYGLPLAMGSVGAGLGRLCAVAGIDGDSLKRAKRYRVGTLKGYGNAISPEPAIEFIASWMGAAA